MPTPTAGPGSPCVVCDKRVEQDVDPVEAASGPGLDVRGLVVMTEDPAVEVVDRHVDARRAEVGDEDVAAVGPEGQLPRRAAAGARSDVALGHQSALDELADPLGDDRPAETRPRHELRPRAGPPEPDLVEDDDERVERLVRQGAEPTRPFRGGVEALRDHRRMIRACASRRGLLHLT